MWKTTQDRRIERIERRKNRTKGKEYVKKQPSEDMESWL
jgi:hypothetical protein